MRLDGLLWCGGRQEKEDGDDIIDSLGHPIYTRHAHEPPTTYLSTYDLPTNRIQIPCLPTACTSTPTLVELQQQDVSISTGTSLEPFKTSPTRSFIYLPVPACRLPTYAQHASKSIQDLHPAQRHETFPQTLHPQHNTNTFLSTSCITTMALLPNNHH